MLPFLLAVLLGGAFAPHPGTLLHKQTLTGPKALCNDGTPATYYTPDGAADGNVMIWLQVTAPTEHKL